MIQPVSFWGIYIPTFLVVASRNQYVVEDAATRKVSIYSMLLLFIQ